MNDSSKKIRSLTSAARAAYDQGFQQLRDECLAKEHVFKEVLAIAMLINHDPLAIALLPNEPRKWVGAFASMAILDFVESIALEKEGEYASD